MRISETAIKAAVPPVFLVCAVFKLFSFFLFDFSSFAVVYTGLNAVCRHLSLTY